MFNRFKNKRSMAAILTLMFSALILTACGSDSTSDLDLDSDLDLNLNSIDFGKALSLDGLDDTVEIADLKASDTYTISAWVNMSYTTDEYATLFDFGNNPAMGMDASTDGYWELFDSATYGDFALPATPAVKNEWIHMTFVYGGGEFYIYGNGVELSHETLTPITLNTVAGFAIGSLYQNDEYVHGMVDEVAVWNVEKTAVEIQAMMIKPLIGTETGLIAYYNFDETEIDGVTVKNIVNPGAYDAVLLYGAMLVPSTVIP